MATVGEGETRGVSVGCDRSATTPLDATKSYTPLNEITVHCTLTVKVISNDFTRFMSVDIITFIKPTYEVIPAFKQNLLILSADLVQLRLQLHSALEAKIQLFFPPVFVFRLAETTISSVPTVAKFQQ